MTREEWINFRNGKDQLRLEWLYEYYVKHQEENQKEVMDFNNFHNIFPQYTQFGNLNKFIKSMDDLFEVSFLNTKEGNTIKCF